VELEYQPASFALGGMMFGADAMKVQTAPGRCYRAVATRLNLVDPHPAEKTTLSSRAAVASHRSA
jgi:hypothetical protein